MADCQYGEGKESNRAPRAPQTHLIVILVINGEVLVQQDIESILQFNLFDYLIIG